MTTPATSIAAAFGTRASGDPLEVDGEPVPLKPPADWFQPPASGIPTDRRLTIEAGGRVYGYIALWNACHIGREGCTPPPKGSPSDYQLAHPGETETAVGDLIATANIGGDVGHARDDAAEPRSVVDHYDNVASAAMRVRYGEDEHGLWFAGALWPDLSELDVARLRAASISGDWQWTGSWRVDDGGAYDFTGAVLVNLPGFPLESAGGVSTSPGTSHQLVASLAAAGLKPDVIGFEGEYFRVDHGDETMTCSCTPDTKATPATARDRAVKARVKAGAFDGTVESLIDRIIDAVVVAVEQSGARNEDVDGESGDGEIVLEADELLAAITADPEGDAGGSMDDGEIPQATLDAVAMKLDQVLERVTAIDTALIEASAADLTAELSA